MLLPILAALLSANPTPTADFRFVTPEHEVTMRVEFPPAYRGEPLTFYGSEGAVARRCLTEHCIDRFYGSVAVVNFLVIKTHAKTKTHAKASKPARLREVVTILEQGADLPHTPKLDLTRKIVDGQIGDVQLMGYDEDEIPSGERDRMRREAPARMWRQVRQELYLNGATKPFAVVEWRHTMQGVSIERINETGPSQATSSPR